MGVDSIKKKHLGLVLDVPSISLMDPIHSLSLYFELN